MYVGMCVCVCSLSVDQPNINSHGDASIIPHTYIPHYSAKKKEKTTKSKKKKKRKNKCIFLPPPDGEKTVPCIRRAGQPFQNLYPSKR